MKHDKHDDKERQRLLRAAIDKMPHDVGKIVQRAAREHGLLPGGGHDDDKHDDKGEKKKPASSSPLNTIADPAAVSADALKGRKK